MNHFVSDHQIYQDLHVLEERALLAPGAAVIADNVLKPGAPRFLWKLRSKRRGNRSGEIYHAQILSLQVRSFCCGSGKFVCICRSKDKLPSIWNLLTWMVELFFLGGKVGIVSFQGSRIHLISCVFFDGCKEGSTLSQWFNVFLKRCIFRSVWFICVLCKLDLENCIIKHDINFSRNLRCHLKIGWQSVSASQVTILAIRRACKWQLVAISLALIDLRWWSRNDYIEFQWNIIIWSSSIYWIHKH